jgi:hypothetical protein
MARTPQTPFEIALTSFTSKDRMNFFHAFAAVPVTQGTVVEVAGGTVVVATILDASLDLTEHEDNVIPMTIRVDKTRLFIAPNKVGEAHTDLADDHETLWTVTNGVLQSAWLDLRAIRPHCLTCC